ncbi:UDP-N-acetylmuramoyl-tripeptide--D-alanyl-D-alanine ligase [Gammaproteobacteria bacterium]|nr:UDP-N-acetylmuramoyl-tripeptide--D-alanyl-D-alanine ligase [Gammaproteobacteria bacterium]
MFKLIDIDDLEKLAQVVDGQLLGENTAFESLIVDSRKAEQNSVFIALHGEKFDGNVFCSEVLSKGCCAVITDDPEIPGRTIVVDDTYLALLKLAQYQLNKVKPRTLAITGSNGKTTVKEMIGSLLDHQNTVATKDNENNEFGIAYTVLKIDKDTENLILECGARKAGDFDLIVKYLWFDALVITNLNNSHIGIFGSEEIIKKTKLKLLEGLKTKGLLIEGAFKNLSKSLRKQDPTKDVINIYYVNEESDLSLKYSWLFNTEINESDLDSYYISMINKDAESESERLNFSLNLGIRHNCLNAVISTALMKEWGSSEQIIQKLHGFVSPQKNRFYCSKLGDHILINDTYNANPTSMLSAINELKTNPNYPDSQIIIIGDMYELGKSSELEHVNILNELMTLDKLKLLILVGDRFKVSYKANTRAIESNYIFHLDRDAALPKEVFKNTLINSSVILVKGSRGMKMERYLDYLRNNII